MATDKPDIHAVFDEAVARGSHEERSRYLDEACGNDPKVRGRVESLLRAHSEAGGFFGGQSPASPATEIRPVTEQSGDTIGPYKLLEQIGEGGMGVVYMAEQKEPVERRVALKIIKPGMDTRQVIARFEAERHALAMMDHPNIARVLDAGTTGGNRKSEAPNPKQIRNLKSEIPNLAEQGVSDIGASDLEFVSDFGFRASDLSPGRPYFVMELVKGVPITHYCDERHLTPRERLELFLPICQAIQHAHQKGIIHRDIKPSNILVAEYDQRPVPKVIDFGVAKAISRTLAEKSMCTGPGQIVGTLEYMSPEQAGVNQLDVDTRSDIYALGVLLYELLTGSLPFDQERVREAGYDDVRRMIREEEPPRPSTRISTLGAAATAISARRRTDPTRLSRMLRRELDWIVMKALQKDRSRRYQTASDFARDIDRYLADEPIEARPPMLLDRAAKWARRHRPVVWSSAAVLGVAVVASLASALLIGGAYEREKTQRIAAETNEARAMTGEELAKKQEELAKQQEALAKQQRKIAIQQKGEAERQRDAAEAALYAADIQIAYHDCRTGQSYRLESRLDAQVPKPGRPDFRGWEWYYLLSQCHAERLVLPCQYVFGWSPDGKHLATADYIGLVNIWDVTSGERKASLKGCPVPTECISWSPDGKHVAAGTDRGTVMIWEVASGTRVRSLMGGGTVVSLIDWNPDGRRLAAGDGERGIWRPVLTETGTITISIWDWRAGKILSSLVGPAGALHSLDWHPDRCQLVAVYGPRHNRGLKIWDTAISREIAGWPTGGGPAAAFSPDGSRLVWGINPVRVTDLKTRKVVSSFPDVEGFHSTWSASGDRVASTCYGGSIRIWDAATGAEVRSISTNNLRPWLPIAWSLKGEFVAGMSYYHGAASVWDTAVAGKATIFDAPREYPTVAFSPDGKRLLVSAEGESLRIYDVESGAVTPFGQHRPNRFRRVDWSLDGKRFATTTAPGRSVLICDANTGEVVLPPLQCEDVARSLAWRPDGSILAVGLERSGSGRVKLFSASTGKELAASAYAAGECTGVAWSPDGKRLVAAGNPLRIWDSDLHPQPFAVTTRALCVDWSADGHKIAAGTKGIFDDSTVTIYDAASGTPLHVLEGHGVIGVVRWHPSMPRLASGGRDGMVRIWDTSTGHELCTLKGHVNTVCDLDWSPDGWRLASVGADGSIHIWDASPANRFVKRHGDLRATVWRKVGKLLAEYYAGQRKEAMSEEFQEALDLLQRLRTLHPQEKELEWQFQHVEWLRATQLARAGQTDKAIAIFNQLTAQSPELPDYRLQLPGVLFDAGRETQAIEMIEKTVAEFPQRPEYREELAYLYERRAIRLCQVGDLPNAVLILRKLAKQSPERPRHRSQVARQLTAQLPKEKRLAAFQSLVREFPDAPEYRRALAPCLGESGQRDKAIAELSEAIRLDPRNVDGYASRANLYEAMGDFEKALADLGKAIELEPENAERRLSRAALYVRQKKWDLAIADLSQAARLKPSDEVARAHHDLAQVLQKNGRADEAEKEFRQAFGIWDKLRSESPDGRQYRQHAAWTLYAIGQLRAAAKGTAEAEQCYRRALGDYEKLAADYPTEAFYRQEMAHISRLLAHLLNDAGRIQEAEKACRQGAAIHEKLVAEFPDVALYRARLSGNLGELAENLLQQGKHAEAVKVAEKVPNVIPEDSNGYRRAAEFFSRCVRLAEKDTKLSEKDRKAVAQAYAKRSEELMREAAKRSEGKPASPGQKPKQ